MADEEIVEGGEEYSGDEGSGSYPAGTEFVPESSAKPKPDVYSVLLIMAFLAFLVGIVVAGRELHQNYDVQFLVLKKDLPKQK